MPPSNMKQTNESIIEILTALTIALNDLQHGVEAMSNRLGRQLPQPEDSDHEDASGYLQLASKQIQIAHSQLRALGADL